MSQEESTHIAVVPPLQSWEKAAVVSGAANVAAEDMPHAELCGFAGFAADSDGAIRPVEGIRLTPSFVAQPQARAEASTLELFCRRRRRAPRPVLR